MPPAPAGNPLFGVLLHWLGGLSSASFYVPYRKVQHWSWEIFWSAGGFFSWIAAPWLMAYFWTNDLLGVLSAAPASVWFWCYLFGALWGLGGLTFGLTMRYLGLSLGMAIALGLTAAFGTLMPPLFSGELFSTLIWSRHGQIILLGLLVCLAGIAVVGRAGSSKERDFPANQKQSAIVEFDLKKGISVAVFSGIMSACFAYGLAAGEPVRQLTLHAGTTPIWQGLPVLCIVLLGGATTNFIWCAILVFRNGTVGEYFGDADPAADGPARPPLMRNYLLCALAGTVWYFQFFFYTMGESQMGRFGFSSWTLHMASIIIFSSLWGFALREWKGASKRTLFFVFAGLGLLVTSTAIIGLANALTDSN
jgi:L-rhamnose-H+ transport protein